MLSKSNIAIVLSDYNSDITSCLLENTLRTLHDNDISSKQIKVVHVPGAFEVPIVAGKYIENKMWDCVICLACVIRGETSHYDYICQESSRAIMDLNMRVKKPVIFGMSNLN